MATGRVIIGSMVFWLSCAGLLTVADAEASGVALPDIPRGQGDNCVEDTDMMRRNHMDMLEHQRDETVLSGVRNKQYSLRECVTCHTVEGADKVPVTYSSPEHFCRSCHDYAAVMIDCFQCHASRPEVAAAESK